MLYFSLHSWQNYISTVNVYTATCNRVIKVISIDLLFFVHQFVLACSSVNTMHCQSVPRTWLKWAVINYNWLTHWLIDWLGQLASVRALQKVRVLQVAAWGRSQGFTSGYMGQVTEFCEWLHGAGHRVLQVAAWGRSQSFASGCIGQVTENFAS